MISALPSSLQQLLPRISAAISRWPLHLSIETVARWVLQFDPEDYSLAVRVLEHLDVLGSADIRSALEVAHTKLLRSAAEKGSPISRENTLYAGIGNSAKSGALMAYHYRVAADLPEGDFVSGEDEEHLDLSKIENIVLVDDVIGTGKTAASEVKRLAEEVYSLSPTRNLFVLTVAAYTEGIDFVTTATGASLVSALTYGNRDTVTALDAAFYDGLPVIDRSSDLDRLKRYCRSISKSELGHGSVGGLLVFDHNTPNTTLPIIWHDGKGWTPLFPRSRRIVGAAKVFKSAQNARSQQTAKPHHARRVDSELTLFVEGRTDELFVERLRLHFGLAQALGVKDAIPIALGGLYSSERLFELLKSARKHAVFILDDDENSRRATTKPHHFADLPVIHLRPSFVAMLDLDKLYASRERFPRLPDRVDTYDPRWFSDLEYQLLKRPVSSERASQVIDEFLDPSKYEQFVQQLKEKVDTLFEPVPTAPPRNSPAA